MNVMRNIALPLAILFSIALALVGHWCHIPGTELAPIVVAVLAASTQKPTARRTNGRKTKSRPSRDQ